MELKAGGDTAGAIAAFQRAIELKPDFEKAHYNLGIALRAQGKTDAAQKELERAEWAARVPRAPGAIEISDSPGRGCAETAEARRCAGALSESPSSKVPSCRPATTIWASRGSAKKTPRAPWRPIEKALELKPDYAQAHSSLGLLYWRQNDRTRALEEFRQAVMSDPDLAEAHYNLGLALAQSGHLDEAVRELNEAISLDPKYTDARIQLGLVLSQNNDTAGAANVFRELVRRDPNFAEAHNNLGLVLLQAGDAPTAQAEFVEAVRLKPRYAEAHYNLALALHQEGKEEESRAEFEKAYEISPELRNAPHP